MICIFRDINDLIMLNIDIQKHTQADKRDTDRHTYKHTVNKTADIQTLTLQ